MAQVKGERFIQSEEKPEYMPMAHVIKNLPIVQGTQETWVQSLGREDSLEEGMATHSRSLAWENPWAEEPGRLQSMGLQRIEHD